MAMPSKTAGLGPPKDDESDGGPLADALEVALGTRPSLEQVVAFRLACKLACDEYEDED